MAGIEYAAPDDLSSAVALLAKQPPGRARLLAGGTDLLLALPKAGQEHLVVDLKRIPDLTTTTLGEDGLRIGPAQCCALFTKEPDVGRIWPGLTEAAALIGSSQVQGRASIGGNLCNASPAADTVPSLIVLGAVAEITGPGGKRTLPVAEFTTGPGRNALGHDEILSAILVPRPPRRSADAYLRLIPRSEMDIAVAGAAASISLDEGGRINRAAVAIGAVAPTARAVPGVEPLLVGHKPTEIDPEGVADVCRQAASPISDRRGTATYRRQVVGVLAKRAVLIAIDRIGRTAP